MKKISLLLAGLLALASNSLLLAAEPLIEFQELPDGENSYPALVWIEDDDSSWMQGAPTFTASSSKGDARAEGWLASNQQNLLLKIIVHDKIHVNEFKGRDIWKGDSIQIGIDARGNTPAPIGGLGGEKLEPSVASLTLALTKDGPKVWAHFQSKYGIGNINGGRNYPCQITRNEETGTTTYEASLPWLEFNSVPGLFPTVGLAFKFNNLEALKGDETSFTWGAGMEQIPRPWLFKKFSLTPPIDNFCASASIKNELWDKNDYGAIMLSFSSDKLLTATVTLGDFKKSSQLPPVKGKIHRVLVRATPPPEAEGKNLILEVSLLSPSGIVMTVDKCELKRAYALKEELCDLFAKLKHKAESSNRPLFAEHFRSLISVVEDEWAKTLLIHDKNAQAAQVCLAAIEKMLVSFKNDAADIESYLSGRRPLLFAWPSSGRLSCFQVFLPANWSPDKKFPLFFEIFGSGSPSKRLSLVYDSDPLDDSEKNIAALRRDGYAVTPFGHGPNDDSVLSETEVQEALCEFGKNFSKTPTQHSTDPDRRYLYGFLPDGGVWRIAAHTPDKWAAVGAYVGPLADSASAISLAQNLFCIPVWLGTIDQENFKKAAEMLQAELARLGNKANLSVFSSPEEITGQDVQAKLYDWLITQKRKRPDHFVFLSDSAENKGAWGIMMIRDPQLASATPRFECEIKDNLVTVSSQGAASLNINAAEGGLGLSGKIKIIWNGKALYEGPAKPDISLGKKADDKAAVPSPN